MSKKGLHAKEKRRGRDTKVSKEANKASRDVTISSTNPCISPSATGAPATSSSLLKVTNPYPSRSEPRRMTWASRLQHHQEVVIGQVKVKITEEAVVEEKEVSLVLLE